jgi:hypothetical protein
MRSRSCTRQAQFLNAARTLPEEQRGPDETESRPGFLRRWVKSTDRPMRGLRSAGLTIKRLATASKRWLLL